MHGAAPPGHGNRRGAASERHATEAAPSLDLPDDRFDDLFATPVEGSRAAWSVSRASARPPPCGTVASPFGVVVAEALAYQKAVVASAVGGIPEIIENGRSGVLVQPDSALVRGSRAVLHY